MLSGGTPRAARFFFPMTAAASPCLPTSVDDVLALLDREDYVADRRLATSAFLALRMGRPMFLEGEAGVGKTELAKVLARGLDKKLVRLQCYEGLDISSARTNGITRGR
jgi:MoxR-like ATPase